MESESPEKSSWLDAIRQFGRYLLPVLKVLFTAFLILHAISLMQSLLRWAQEAKGFSMTTPIIEQVEPIPGSPNVVQVTGRWIPDSVVAFKLNDRMEGTRLVGKDGRFTSPLLSLSRQSNEVTVIPVSPQNGRLVLGSTAWKTIPFTASQQGPKVELWVEVPNKGAILLGAADPYQLLTLDGPGIESIVRQSDRYGIFTFMVPASVVNSPGDFHLGVASYLPPKGSKNSGAPLPVLNDSNKATLSRSITIKVSPQQSDFELMIKAPAKLPYIARLLQGDMNNDSFVNYVFGNTGFSLYRLDSAPLERSTLIGSDGYAQITLKGSTKEREKLSLTSSGIGLGEWPLLSPKDSFTVTLDQVTTAWTKPLPSTTDGNAMTWTGPLDQIELGVQGPPSEEAGQTDDQGKKQAPGIIAHLMSVVGWTLLAIIPFVWIVWLVHTDDRFLADHPPQFVRARQRIVAVCVVLSTLCLWQLIYALAIYFTRIPAALLGTDSLPWSNTVLNFITIWISALAVVPLVVRPLEETTQEWLGQLPLGLSKKPSRFLRVLKAIVTVGLVLVIAYLVTIILKDFFPQYNRALWILVLGIVVIRVLGLRLGLGFLVLSAITTVLSLFTYGGIKESTVEPLKTIAGMLKHSMDLGKWQTIGVVAGLYLLLMLACLWVSGVPVAKRVLKLRSRFFFTIASGFIVVAMVLLPGRTTIELAGIVPVAISLWLVLYVAEVLSPLQLRPASAFSTKWFIRMAAVVVVVFVALLRPTSAHTPDIGYLYPLFGEMERLYKYIPLLLIVSWLRLQTANAGSILAEKDIRLGHFFFAVYVVGYLANWQFLPVPLILGYLLARYWLIQAPKNIGDLSILKKSKRELLDNVIRSQKAEKILGSLNKNLEDKMKKGDLSPADYTSRLDEARTALHVPASADDALVLKQAPLALGPAEDAWSNARIALQYGLPLALGPTALAIYDFAVNDARSQDSLFPSLVFFLRALLSLADWLLLAFFFGFFYTHIRGKSGLTKGVSLTVATLVPYVCLNLLLTSSLADFKLFLLWGGQIFAFCTVLGILAFDYETLRRNGFSFRQLSALHNIPALSAFASSLTAAVVPAVIAIVNSRAVDLVKFVTNWLLPKPPTK